MYLWLWKAGWLIRYWEIGNEFFENDSFEFKYGEDPLGTDASACNAFWAKICPWKHSSYGRYLPLRSSPAVQPKRHTDNWRSTKRSGSATFIVPKALGASTAAWDGWGIAHLGALAGRNEQITSFLRQVVAPARECSTKAAPASSASAARSRPSMLRVKSFFLRVSHAMVQQAYIFVVKQLGFAKDEGFS